MTSPLSAPSSLAGAAQAPSSKPDVKKVAQQFEALFLRQMIGSMRQASLSDGMFDSSASDQFRDMADSKLADSMSTQGGFGLATLLARQIGGTGTPEAPAAPAAGTGTGTKAKP